VYLGQVYDTSTVTAKFQPQPNETEPSKTPWPWVGTNGFGFKNTVKAKPVIYRFEGSTDRPPTHSGATIIHTGRNFLVPGIGKLTIKPSSTICVWFELNPPSGDTSSDDVDTQDQSRISPLLVYRAAGAAGKSEVWYWKTGVFTLDAKPPPGAEETTT